ncbi:MAG: type II secretion system GspH family protein [Spirochaetes bacterium]|jgi:type II secretion system protein I|nr:type II secretion system GspH family protein [Spirochaetota bacterium]
MSTSVSNNGRGGGFALVEILLAIAILSIAMLGIISGVSSGIAAIGGNRNMTRAMLIAKSRLSLYHVYRMREPDVQEEPVKEYPGFAYSRKTTKFEHELFGPVSARRVEITVHWLERGRRKNYTLSYVYPERM